MSASTLPHSFQVLSAAWQQDAASHHVEILAANLAANLAVTGRSCIGLVKLEAVRQLYGLACFLATFGITLQWRYRTSKDAVFLFAGIKKEK